MSGNTLLKPLNSSKRDWRSPIRKMVCGLSFLLWLALLQTTLAVNVPGPNGTVVTQILSATSSNPEVKVVEDRDLGKILVYPPQPKEFTVEIIARIMYPDDQYLEKISTVMVGGAGVTIESDEIRNSLILATLKVAPGASGGRFSITYENEDNPNHKGCNVRLLPVEVEELYPMLVNEKDVVIADSDKPALQGSTEMVERDPEASITNASTVRIAWRDMKVKIGKPLAGKKVTWSMTAQFIPDNENGTAGATAIFRGKWGTAVNTKHRHRFSASEQYGENGYKSLTSEQETVTNAQVTLTAETVVDPEGYTAIRVNLPPVGYNKAQIKIAIEDIEAEIDLIELEVPAVISIDPGHGKGPDLAGSSANNGVGVNSNVLERDLALSYGLELRDSLKAQIAKSKLKAKVLMTREVDMNIKGNTRAFLARDKGVDVHFIIHFNAFGNSSARGTLEVRQHVDQVNKTEDVDLIDPIIGSIATALKAYDAGANKRSFVNKDTTTAFDPKLQNTATYHPIRAGYCEVEFLTNPAADALLTGANKKAVQTAVTNEMRDGILKNLKTFK